MHLPLACRTAHQGRWVQQELEKGLTVMLNDYTIVEAMEAEQAPRPAEAGPSGEPAKPAKASLKSRASGGKRSRSTARGEPPTALHDALPQIICSIYPLLPASCVSNRVKPGWAPESECQGGWGVMADRIGLWLAGDRGRPRGGSPPGSGPGSDLEAEAGFWQCASCTYANHDMAANSCEMCDTRRPAR